MKKQLVVSAALVVLAAISGCASVPMAPANADESAKTFAAIPGKASVYIYRNESMGGAIKMGIYVDEKPIGQTAAHTYLNLALEPGMHKIRGHAENQSELNLDAKEGENYFIWQEVKMGWGSARNQLQFVDAETGKKGVGDCKLAAAGQ